MDDTFLCITVWYKAKVKSCCLVSWSPVSAFPEARLIFVKTAADATFESIVPGIVWIKSTIETEASPSRIVVSSPWKTKYMAI